MIIVMKAAATEAGVESTVRFIERLNLKAHMDKGAERCVIGVVGDTRRFQPDQFARLEGVDHVTRITRPYKLASREFIPQNSYFPLDGVDVGGNGIIVIAGP